MANFLTNFLDANDLLCNSQFGFRHNHSTSHAIITLIEKISRALDTGKIVCGIFIDFRKAFDVIPHNTLLKKLYAYGILEKYTIGLKVIFQTGPNLYNTKILSQAPNL